MQNSSPPDVPTPDRTSSAKPSLEGPEVMDDLLRAAFGKPRVSAGLEDLPSVVTRLRKAVGEIDSVFLTPSNASMFDEAGPVVLPSIPSRSLDRYQLLGRIAHGGMGTVYLARDLDLGRELAIKVLRDEHVGDAPMTQRFVEESQIAGQLEHPGIVPVHELGLIGENKPYLAMKLIRGETLASLLRKRKDTAEERTRFVAIFEDVCRPIAYAHFRRVVHRDLKPANIMVGGLGEVQVADWGLAKVLATRGGSSPSSAPQDEREVRTCRSGSSAGASLSGSIIGTPGYMSPEQARGEVERIDERSDVFGLGAILCEILTGLPPYHGGSRSEQIRQAAEGQLADAYRRLDACGADAPLVTLAKGCLAVDRHDRPRDAGEVANSVRDYRETMDRRARDMEIRIAQSRSRRRWLTALCLVLCLAALGVWRLTVARHERRELTTLRAAQAISEARGRRSAAEAAAIDDVASWNAALQAARAVDSLLTNDVDNLVRNDARQLAADVESRFVQARLLARLRKLRDDQVESFSDFDAGENYADAFSEYFGVNFETLTRDEAVRRCRQSPIVEELALALDEWAIVRHTNGEDWRSLAAIAAATSTAPWRPVLHTELARDDFDQVVAEVEPFLDEDVPNSIRSMLAFALWMAKIPARSRSLSAATDEERSRWSEFVDECSSATESLLRRAIELEPDNFRINCQLAETLATDQDSVFDELPFRRAASALRPTDGRSWLLLGQAYHRAKNIRGTLEAHTQMLASYSNRPETYSDILATISVNESMPRKLLSRLTNAMEDWYVRDSEQAPGIHRTLEVAWEKLDRLSSDKALRLTEDYVTRTRRREPEGLALLAKVQFARGMAAEAARNLEEAQTLRGDMTWRGEELATYRASVHPAIVSFASLDAAWETAVESNKIMPEAIGSEPDSARAEAYRAYWQGRTFEWEGRLADAADQYRAAQRADDAGFEPTLRLASVLEAMERHAEAAEVLSARIASAPLAPVRLWRQWAATSLATGRTPEQLLANFPGNSRSTGQSDDSAIHLSEVTYEDDLRRLVSGLAREGNARINCGGREYIDPDGRLWMRDAFFTGGSIFINSVDAPGRRIAGTELDPLYQTERWGGFRYQIPLPSGQYRVVLHFAEIYDTIRRGEEPRIFDVLTEDQMAREALNIHATVGFASALTVDRTVNVSDAALDIGFQRRAQNPKISAIEIERTGP